MDEETPEDVAAYHVLDTAVQEKYGVKFLTYWYDEDRGTTFCLVDAPDMDTAEKVHAEAHGNLSNEMIEVDLSAVEAFLGRVQDPPSAASKPINESAFRGIMFTDMVGSTEMTTRLGDTMAVEYLRAHDAIIRRELVRHCGSEVKHLGDGIMASFDDVASSVSCSLSIQQGFAAYNQASKAAIQVRIGIHAGEPVSEKNDLFGSVVQLASRICDATDAGGVLVSQEVVTACEGKNIPFVERGTRNLKGFSTKVALFSPTR